MSNVETISWPKDFPELKRLDNLLRCGICYDYMKTSMITSCSHNYCSLCIRKYMQYKTMCPTCFEETHKVNLRNNRPLDEIILIFTTIRDKIVRHLRIAAIHLPVSNEIDNKNDNASPVKSIKKNNSIVQSKNIEESTLKIVRKLDKDLNNDCENERIKIISPTTPTSSKVSSVHSNVTPVTKIPSIFYSPKKSASSVSPAAAAVPTVSCPVCSVDIPERNINAHLDNCLARVTSSPKCEPKVLKRDPIPKRVYSMMSEKDLRKWLKNYGLSTVGDKKALISRLQRFTVLHNSDCDTENPRSINEIIRQVEKEEKDEKLASNNLGVVRKPVSRNADANTIEEENKKYIEKNKSNFENLIKTMRERDQKYIKPTRPINRIESDNSDDEDSFSKRETVPMISQPTTSKFHVQNQSLKGVKNEHYNFCDDLNEIFEISPESPDLCPNKSSPKEFKRIKIGEVEPDSNVVYAEAEVYIDKHETESPEQSVNNIKLEKPHKLSAESLDVDEAAPLVDNNCIVEVVYSDNSEDSSNSVSLLADYKDPDEENQQILNKSPVKKTVSHSEIIDPNFFVTDSELNLANMSEESEDLFVPSKRKKRQRPEQVEYKLSKRVLRKRTTK